MKKYCTLYLLLLLIVSVWAVDANEFLIGAYSQYQIRYAGSNFAAKFDSLGVYLNNAGYNATVYSLTSEHESRLSTIFQKLHESNIKSMLHDNTWSPYNGRLGVGSTTFGNRLQIEAEYQLKTEVVNGNTVFVVDDLSTENQTLCMESYDYVTKHEVGNRVYDTGEYQYSNGFAWLCDSNEGHTAGIALSYPRKRWKPSWASWPSLLSKDIVFYTNAINDNKLYISLAIQHENVALGDPVASVKLKLYLPPSDHIEGEEYDQFYYER